MVLPFLRHFTVYITYFGINCIISSMLQIKKLKLHVTQLASGRGQQTFWEHEFSDCFCSFREVYSRVIN